MSRRQFLRLIALLGAPAALTPAALAQSAPERTLSLYGLALKDTDATRLLEAALAAGGVRQPGPPGSAPVLDTRGIGVPALQRLTLVVHEGKVASVRFLVKGYGEDNVELRALLLGKYGIPMTVGARPLPFAGFAGRAAPRGGFRWTFDDGMTLTYEHPRIGDVTLSYEDPVRMAALAAASGPAPRPTEDVRGRF